MSRILLVEREHYEHALLAQTLRAEGCEVYEVADRSHLAAVVDQLDQAHEPLDLIIADAEQSGGVGVELLLVAQSLLGKPPMILLTEEVDEELEDEAIALDARFVFKIPCPVGAVRLATLSLTHPNPDSEDSDAMDSEETLYGSAH
jgi:CheY-like chemotaxis protein